MNETAYWIWLLKTLGPAAPIRDILAVFKSPRGLYEAGRVEWRLSGILTPKQMEKLTRFSPSESGDVLHACRENGWQILTPEDICYPKELLDLPNFPPVLFVWGNPEALLASVKISLVGTRKASQYARAMAGLLSEALTKSGVVIVSGGALGVDSAAHKGALLAGGKTIAVLGCGLGTDYLKENAALRLQIAQTGGAVISEFLPFSPASRTTFPLRNRIIAGLSLGTVVVEAGERSGSLITARLALEQGKDVFAVPGDLVSSAYSGANKLLRDGAKPVFAPMDVLEEYIDKFPKELVAKPSQKSFRELLLELRETQKQASPAAVSVVEAKKPQPPKEKPKPKEKQKEKPKEKRPKTPKDTEKTQPPQAVQPIVEAVSEPAKKVLEALGTQVVHIDDLCIRTQLPVQKVLSALTELELFGYVALQEAKKYKRI